MQQTCSLLGNGGGRPAVWADLSPADLAKIAQNPVGNVISVPIQENMNLNAGPYEQNLSVLNIQPVIPFNINEDWNIITRWILPFISQAPYTPDHGRTSGFGPLDRAVTTQQFFARRDRGELGGPG